jgi:hypothetical protein
MPHFRFDADYVFSSPFCKIMLFQKPRICGQPCAKHRRFIGKIKKEWRKRHSFCCFPYDLKKHRFLYTSLKLSKRIPQHTPFFNRVRKIAVKRNGSEPHLHPGYDLTDMPRTAEQNLSFP